MREVSLLQLPIQETCKFHFAMVFAKLSDENQNGKLYCNVYKV